MRYTNNYSDYFYDEIQYYYCLHCTITNNTNTICICIYYEFVFYLIIIMLCIKGLRLLAAVDCRDDNEKIITALVVDALPDKTKIIFIYCLSATVSDSGKDDIIPTLYRLCSSLYAKLQARLNIQT